MFPVLTPVETQKSHLDLMTHPEIPTISKLAPSNPEDWEEIEITIDSGACDTVLPSHMLPGVQLEDTEASRNGEEYEVANGHSIFNEGQKHV